MIEAPDAVSHEREKYSTIWGFEDYHKFSPGLENVERFYEVINPPSGGKRLIDFGCGDGRAGLEFAKRGMRVEWLDLTDEGLVDLVPRARFHCQPLWLAPVHPALSGHRFDYGFCCDVMEHLPPEYTMLAISRMLDSCDLLWMQISTVPDSFGALVGEPLHLTVQPFRWWLSRIGSLAEIIDARDLCNAGLFVARGRK